MGLDMYLYKKTYVKNWQHNGPERQHEITIKKGGEVRKDIKPERISYIIEEVAYWRKFNALHGWFVNECADGVDECQAIYVTNEKMKELLETLKKVSELINKSTKTTKVLQDWHGKDYEVSVYDCEDEVKDIFSPTAGFFFGGTEIDDYYKSDVEETIKTIEDLLSEDEEGYADFEYQASW